MGIYFNLPKERFQPIIDEHQYLILVYIELIPNGEPDKILRISNANFLIHKKNTDLPGCYLTMVYDCRLGKTELPFGLNYQAACGVR